MLRSESFPIHIKRILLFLTVIILAALQNTEGLLPRIFGAHMMPLIPLIISVGMLEGEMYGLVYGALAGAFWDVCASGPDGLHALFLALTGCITGVLVHYIMKNRLLTQYCICAVSSVAYAVVYWLCSVYIPLGDAGGEKLLTFYLPSAVVTTVFSFLIYYFVRFICTHLKEKEMKT